MSKRSKNKEVWKIVWGVAAAFVFVTITTIATSGDALQEKVAQSSLIAQIERPENLDKGPFAYIWNALEDLQQQINEIELLPGPEGPQGPPGADHSADIQTINNYIDVLTNKKHCYDVFNDETIVSNTSTLYKDIDFDCPLTVSSEITNIKDIMVRYCLGYNLKLPSTHSGIEVAIYMDDTFLGTFNRPEIGYHFVKDEYNNEYDYDELIHSNYCGMHLIENVLPGNHNIEIRPKFMRCTDTASETCTYVLKEGHIDLEERMP